MSQLNSAIYSGWVKHQRYFPKAHSFKYRVFMMYLDLDEIPQLQLKSRWWSFNRKNLAEFRQADYFRATDKPLKQAIQEHVQETIDLKLNGKVCMLTNFRYFGFIMNPLTVYYCFDEQEKLQAMVLEVTNTPWKKRHCYVLKCAASSPTQKIDFAKTLHVSPFHDMDMCYQLKSNIPNNKLNFHLYNMVPAKNNRIEFDASLAMNRQEISQRSLNRTLLRYPFMTLKVCLSIYWQALRLIIKRTPVYAAPPAQTPLNRQ